MSSPRDPDGFDDDRREEGSGWREPAHLGGADDGAERTPPPQPGRDDAGHSDAGHSDAGHGDAGRSDAGPAWQPPGWDLPPGGAQRPAPPPPEAGPQHGPPAGQGFPPPAPGPMRGGGLFGRRRREPTIAERVFRYEGDLVGAQGWALQQGWTVSDGTAPEDAVLAELIASSPVRATKDHRAGSVLRGRAGSLDVVAFDVVYVSGKYAVPEYAVTAVPMLGGVPGFRLSPARFWRHRTGGLIPLPSGDDAFDARWLLLAAEDSPQLRRLAQDPAVHGLLLGSDDGDEFWSGAGHVAAIRPDGHRPQLLEHHARLLTAVAGALMAGA